MIVAVRDFNSGRWKTRPQRLQLLAAAGRPQTATDFDYERIEG